MFAVFEGIDGAGLATQAGLLRDYLISKGKMVVLTKEPTDGLIGGLTKALLRKEWKSSPFTLQLLYAADRSHHLAVEIEPAIKKNKIVICDRYILSTLAYGTLNINLNFLKQLNVNFRVPDLTILLDAHPKICMQRTKKARFHVEAFEDEHVLDSVRKNYISLKNYFSNTKIVDANKTIEDVSAEIQKIVNKQILGR